MQGTTPSSGPIIVMGSVSRDSLIYPGQPVIEDLGGILYSVLALVSITDRQIIPIANIGEDIFDKVVEVLSSHPTVRLGGLRRVSRPNIHSYLLFANEYGVCYDEGHAIPVCYAQVRKHLGAAAILAPFPTGFDVRLSALKALSRATPAPIYIDYHTLALGRDSVGVRYFKYRPNWLEWVSCATFIQFNWFEAQHVARKRFDTMMDVQNFGEEILASGPMLVVVTRGEHGSYAVFRDNNGFSTCEHIATEKIVQPTDPTGCGDVYAATFLVHYLESQDFLSACRVASRAAAAKAISSGLDSLRKLSAMRPGEPAPE